MLEVSVKGLAELHRELEKVPKKIAANVVRGGVRAAAAHQRKAVAAEIRAQGLQRTGDLLKSLRSSSRIDRDGRVTGYVRTEVWYAHFLEGGTKAHRTRFLGRMYDNPGIREHRFFKRAFDSAAQGALIAARDWMYDKMLESGYAIPRAFTTGEDR